MINRKIALSALLLWVLLLSSCAQIPRYAGVEQTVTYLASDELAGRLPGEPGNLMAQRFLKNTLKQLDIPPAFEEYEHSYDRPIADVKLCSLSFGGRALSYPADLKLFGYTAEALSLEDTPLATADAVPDEPCILLTDDFAMQPPSSAVKAMIYPGANLDSIAQLTEDKKSAVMKLSVLPDTYEALVAAAQSGTPATLRIECEEKVARENNILGKIEAPQEAREAVVLSAHFDHLGASPKGEIFHGAYDNASGVAAVLRIAQQLRDAQPSDLTRDIYIAFVNTEESGIHVSGGSRALATQLDRSYDAVYDLNIDCLGAPGKPLSIMASRGAAPLALDASAFFEELGEPLTAASGTSDHTNFALGVNFCTGFENINTLTDTLDGVDFASLERLALLVGRYASALACGRTLPEVQAAQENNRAALYAEGVMPQFDQCLLLEIDGQMRHIYSDSSGFCSTDSLLSRFGLDLSGLVLSDDTTLYGADDYEGTRGFSVSPFPLSEGERCATGLTSAEHPSGQEQICTGSLPFSAVCRIDFLLNEERVSIPTGDRRTYDAYPNFTIRRYMLSNIAQAMAFEADLAFAQESPACGSYGAWSLYLEPAMPMGSSVQQTVYGVLRDDEAQVAYLWSIGVPLRTLPGFPPDDHAALQNLLDTLRAGEICGRICAAWDTR
ncbi:MAG: hypothetical protein ABT01_05180 [Clostridium sp. SCN 57-10]|nr:MAG: hypothetical protein ABT01_05180 [Clostridium sp. SCN 57-10]